MWQSADAALSAAVVRELKTELGPQAVKEVRTRVAMLSLESSTLVFTSGCRAGSPPDEHPWCCHCHMVGFGGIWQALNCSADSFYSSQGRRDELFHDSSGGAVDRGQSGRAHV